MANDSMGNLEKLGILVIVILVVVVGVVAITPSETLFQPEPGPANLEVAQGEDGSDPYEVTGTTVDPTIAPPGSSRDRA